MSHQFGFEKLIVWQKAKELSVDLYRETRTFPKEERFGLTNQIRRAGISVPSNLAEGSARQTSRDKAHFTTMSFSSLMETTNHLIIAKDLEMLQDSTYLHLRTKIEEVGRMLTALRSAQLR